MAGDVLSTGYTVVDKAVPFPHRAYVPINAKEEGTFFFFHKAGLYLFCHNLLSLLNIILVSFLQVNKNMTPFSHLRSLYCMAF